MPNSPSTAASTSTATTPAASNSAAPDGGPSYFNLLTNGLGYLKRVRTVSSTTKKAQSYLAVSVCAFWGPSNEVNFTWFDCIVAGAEAKKVVGEQLRAAIEAKQKVLVSFVIGDQQLKEFVYKSGAKQGQQGVSTKAHLLLIKWAKVDGQKVYEMPPSSRSVEAENEAIFNQYYADEPEAVAA